MSTLATPTLGSYTVDSHRLAPQCKIAKCVGLIACTLAEKPLVIAFSNCEHSHLRPGFLVWSYSELALWRDEPWNIVLMANQLLGTDLDVAKTLKAYILVRESKPELIKSPIPEKE